MNRNIALVILFLALTVVAVKVINDKKTVSKGKVNNDTTSQASVQITAANERLRVLPDRCIGCGKCVRFDPQHFSIDRTTNKAVVISNNNLDTTGLTAAINVCPAGAIALN